MVGEYNFKKALPNIKSGLIVAFVLWFIFGGIEWIYIGVGSILIVLLLDYKEQTGRESLGGGEKKEEITEEELTEKSNNNKLKNKYVLFSLITVVSFIALFGGSSVFDMLLGYLGSSNLVGTIKALKLIWVFGFMIIGVSSLMSIPFFILFDSLNIKG